MPLQLSRQKIVTGVGLAGLLALLVYLTGRLWPGIGPDYFYHYRAAAADYFAGRTQLYDGNTTSYPLLPWSVFPLGITLLLPVRYGQALLTLFSIFSVLWLTYLIGRNPRSGRIPLWVLFFSVITLHMVDLLIRGNFEGITAFGVALAWYGWEKEKPLTLGMGVVFFVMKPINMVLVGLFFAVGALRRGWRFALWTALPLVVCIVISCFFFGWDWIPRYLTYNTSSQEVYQDLSQSNDLLYLQTALWKFFQEALGLSVVWGYVVSGLGYAATAIYIFLEREHRRETFALVLSASLFFSFYIHGNHYVLLSPVLALLITRSRAYALLWLFTLTPLLRLYWGFQNVWLDNAYALALLVGMIAVIVQDRQALHMQSAAPQAAGPSAS